MSLRGPAGLDSVFCIMYGNSVIILNPGILSSEDLVGKYSFKGTDRGIMTLFRFTIGEPWWPP